MNLYSTIVDILEQGQSLALSRVIRQKGSAPRSVGAKCIVLEDGQLLGTVGGGGLEYQVHKIAKEVVKTQKSTLFQFTMPDKNVDGSQMLCGGEVSVYIEPLTPDNPETMSVYGHIAQASATGSSGRLITRVVSDMAASAIRQRQVVTENGEVLGELNIPPDLIGGPQDVRPRLISVHDAEKYDIFIDPFGDSQTVIIFGGGHISTCLAPILKPLGFSVVIVDERSEYANVQRFPDADHIHATPFSKAFAYLHVNASSYVVILTPEHARDKEVLAESLRHPAAYIGMIASRRKRQAIYRALLAQGVSAAQLEAVYSPIGIDILSETPDEIAISIAAELVRVRAERRRAVSIP